MDANVITTQPSINFANNAEPNLVENESSIITNQPLLNDPNDEEKKKKNFSQFNPTVQKPPETRNQGSNDEVAESCAWCCFVCADCDSTGCDCTGCCDDNGDCCTGCCESGPSADTVDGDDVAGCCTACCESGPSADTIDGDDVAGCFECCGSCSD